MPKLRRVLIATVGVAALTGGLVTQVSVGQAVARTAPARPAGSQHTVTVPLTILSTPRLGQRAAATPLAEGPPVEGDCGAAQLSIRPSDATYKLILHSTQGAIGSGWYTVGTDGIGAIVDTPGSISGMDRTLWTSKWQKVINPGAFPQVAYALGIVHTARASCVLAASAPWN